MVASRNESDSEGEEELLAVSEIEPEIAEEAEEEEEEEEEEETDSRSIRSSDEGGNKAERLDPDVAPARIHYV